MGLIDALRKRRSVTRYSHKKPDWRKIIRSIDYARYTPSAGNVYAIKFILVKDKEKISKLREATQQPFVSTAHFVVIVTSEPEKLKRLYQERAQKYMDMQAGLAIGNFMAALTENSLVTKWVRYFNDEEVRRLFEIPEAVSINGIFPIGIETKIKSPAEVYPLLENILYFDVWKNKNMEAQTRVSEEAA